jgi:hypothetical protein
MTNDFLTPEGNFDVDKVSCCAEFAWQPFRREETHDGLREILGTALCRISDMLAPQQIS